MGIDLGRVRAGITVGTATPMMVMAVVIVVVMIIVDDTIMPFAISLRLPAS
jgi:hypothetical protein